MEKLNFFIRGAVAYTILKWVFEDKTYYGAFQVVPKNFFDDQFEMIQDYVKSILNELILDRGYYKKTFSALSDIEDSSYLVLLRKLPQKMKRIKQIFKKFEIKCGICTRI